MANLVNIGDVYRGENRELVATITTSPPVDGTQWNVTFTLGFPGQTPILSVSQTVTITGAQFTLPLGVLEFTAETYDYDLWRTDSGEQRELATGSFTISERVRP